jgi:hypothetical protein
MAIDFPSSPGNNETYTFNGRTWTYNASSGAWTANGVQGAQGVQGASGAQGVQGTNGVDGAQGAQGAQGVQGTNGVDGAQGSQGFQGVQGTAGTAGAQGAVGAQGAQGVQGTNGVDGAQGSQGFQGIQGAVGAQGAQGVQGSSGSKGDTGDFGGASFYYQFDTETFVENVTDGYVLLTNTNFASANIMGISVIDRFSSNIASFIQTIDDSTSDIKGTIKITEEANSANFVFFAITGTHLDHGNHFDVPVSYTSGTTTPFANNGNVVLTFVVTGDRGDKGAQGFQGVQGAAGAQGEQGFQGVQGSQGIKGDKGEFASGAVTYTSSATAPVSPSEGDEWFNTDAGILFKYVNDGNSNQWIEFGAAGSGSGGSGGVSLGLVIALS